MRSEDQAVVPIQTPTPGQPKEYCVPLTTGWAYTATSKKEIREIYIAPL